MKELDNRVDERATFLIITSAFLGIPLLPPHWSDEEANSPALNSRDGRHDCTRPEADVCFRFLSIFSPLSIDDREA